MKERAVLRLPDEYSVELTLYPSMIYPLFSRVGKGEYAKVVGRYHGTSIKIAGSLAVAKNPRGVSARAAEEWLGIWYDPLEEVSKLSRSSRSRVEPLVEAYRGLRIAISSVDREYVFVSSFLSQNTSFHANTCRWISALAETYGPEFLEKPVDFSRAGSSYQLARLGKSYPIYREVEEPPDLGELRITLMRIPGVGPKVADAYLLFSRRAPESAPCDVHLRRIVARLGLVEYSALPAKNLCSKYYCWVESSCPKKGECLRYIFMRTYGKLSGFIQTASYLHDKLYCSRNRCGECPLREACSR